MLTKQAKWEGREEGGDVQREGKEMGGGGVISQLNFETNKVPNEAWVNISTKRFVFVSFLTQKYSEWELFLLHDKLKENHSDLH